MTMDERFPLPPRPRFTRADVPGHLAEARKLRTIGTGQPIKASWLCLESLDIYRRERLEPDLHMVEALQVLVLCYTDDIKRGKLGYAGPAEGAIRELGELGGIPRASATHARCRRDPGFPPDDELLTWKAEIPIEPAWREGSPAEDRILQSHGVHYPLARFPKDAFPLPVDDEDCVDPSAVPGAEILVADPVRRQARFECLYLHGILGMSQALRVERSTEGHPNPAHLEAELGFLLEAAWWFRLSEIVAPGAPVDAEEACRKARAKSSMLIRRLDKGNHFAMATIESLDRLE